MQFHKQDVIAILKPDLKPDEAKQLLPVLKARYAERIKDTEAARQEVARRKAVLDDNRALLKILADQQRTLSAQCSELRDKLRQELHAFRESFDYDGNASLLRKKTDALGYCDGEYDFILTVKSGADQILYFDAMANEAIAEYRELATAAELSHANTVSALGPAFEAEGGNLGILGSRTEALRDEATAAHRRCEAAKNTAQEARAAYDKQQSALASRRIFGPAQR